MFVGLSMLRLCITYLVHGMISGYTRLREEIFVMTGIRVVPFSSPVVYMWC